MPSANGCIDRLAAKPTGAFTMLAASESSGRFRMNRRSILSTSTGRLRSRLSERYPVPKSSMASRSPAALIWSRARWARSGSRVMVDSAISTIRLPGSTQAADTFPKRVGSAPGCQSWRAERLKESASFRPRADHSAACRSSDAMTESDERLGPHDLARVQVHDRLVLEGPVLPVDGRAQRGGQGGGVLPALAPGREQQGAARRPLLGPIHGRVGLLEEGPGILGGV